MIGGIALILLGCLAVPSFIPAKKSDAKALLDKAAPYQGITGILFALRGVWGKRYPLSSLPVLFAMLLAAASPLAAHAGEDMRRLEVEKWNAYVAMDNMLNASFFPALHSYYQAYGEGKELSLHGTQQNRMRAVGAATSLTNLPKAIDKAAELAAMPPQNALDASVAAVAALAKPLTADLRAFSNYVRNKEYVDDDWAKGQELHGRIVGNTAALTGCLPAYLTAMEEKSVALRLRQVEEMRSGGLAIRPAMLTVVLNAEGLLRVLEEKKATHQNVLQAVSLEAYQPAYTKFSDSLRELEVFQDENVAKAEGLTLSSLSSFRDRGLDFKKEAAALIERLRENKKPVSAGDEGTPENISRTYGNLVDAYNRNIR